MLATAPEILDPDATNALISTYDPPHIVDWAAGLFGEQLVMSSSFGAESAILLHIAVQSLPRIRVIFIDTGYLFPETHQFMETLRQRFDLNIWSYRTTNDPIAYLTTAGEADPTLRDNIPGCCAANKNEPFDRAMRQLQPRAWLRGIRRNQTEIRQSQQVVEWSSRFNCYVISPLLGWGAKEIHRYLTEHDLPYHPLYSKGYASIGCNPLSCTRPITLGQDPRSGRWAGSSKTECGLHLEGGAGI